jgi:hypothetical protein
MANKKNRKEKSNLKAPAASSREAALGASSKEDSKVNARQNESKAHQNLVQFDEVEVTTDTRGRSQVYEEFRFLGAYNAT